MANTFEFIGLLRPVQDTEKMKSFSVTNFNSGWMTERLRFKVISGDNTHFVEINAGRWQNESKNIIYGFTKPENGKKGEPFQVPWAKRNDPEMINKMNGMRIFTVDTETYNHRKELENSGDTEGLEAANKKCKHFLAGTEFCEYVNKVITSDKTKDWKFRIRGNINYTYSEKNDRYYQTYEVNKIYRVEDNTPVSDEVSIDFYFTENAMDATDYEETGKAIVNGYTQYYDQNVKKSVFCPITLAMRFGTGEEGMGRLVYWNEIFSEFDDSTVKHAVLKCDEINGAQRTKVTFDDLSDKTKRAVKFGAKKLEDALAEAGGSVMGPRIQELRVVGFGRDFSDAEATTYEVEDLMKKPVKEEENFDIFNQEDDDL